MSTLKPLKQRLSKKIEELQQERDSLFQAVDSRIVQLNEDVQKAMDTQDKTQFLRKHGDIINNLEDMISKLLMMATHLDPEEENEDELISVTAKEDKSVVVGLNLEDNKGNYIGLMSPENFKSDDGTIWDVNRELSRLNLEERKENGAKIMEEKGEGLISEDIKQESDDLLSVGGRGKDDLIWEVQLGQLEWPLDAEDTKIQVIISAVVSPLQFYVHVVDNKTVKLMDIEEELSVWDKRESVCDMLEIMPLTVGSCWSARCPDDGVWYRTRVITCKKTSVPGRSVLDEVWKTEMFLVDFGNMMTVNPEDIRPLLSSTVEVPGVAVRCHLDGTENDNVWSDESTLYLSKLMENHEVLEALKTASDSTGIWLWRVDDNGVKMLLNDELSSQRLTEPATSNQLVFPGEDCDHENITDSGCFPSPAGEHGNQFDTWNPMTDDFLSEGNDYTVDKQDLGVIMTGSKLYPPEPNISVVVEVNERETPPEGAVALLRITSIASPSFFYAIFPQHISPSKKSQFDLLMTEMQDYYSKSGRDRNDNPLIDRMSGEIVAARSQDTWCRAKVIDVNSTNRSLKVMYIDFGDQEWLPERNVRKLAQEFCHLPSQAVKCSLSEIEPNSDDDTCRWSLQAKNYFYNLVNDKDLTALIVSKQPDSLYVDLYDMNDGEYNISRKLVEAGHAALERHVSSTPAEQALRSTTKIQIIPG